MREISIGKIRGLQQISSDKGIFMICAMDHRDSMKQMIEESGVKNVRYEDMVQRKLELCEALAPHSSAVLLDPNYGAARAIASGVLPRGTGLLVSREASGYKGSKGKRVQALEEGWNAGKIRRMGAAALKLLLFYRPELEIEARIQSGLAHLAGHECAEQDLPFVLEHRSYPLEGEDSKVFSSKQAGLVMETARHLTPYGVDVFKAEFPGPVPAEVKGKDYQESLERCRLLDEICPVPWVVLSAGVDFDTFYKQVEIACRAGASGFLGGRALWQEGMRIGDAKERKRFLSTVAVERMKKLNEAAGKHARPWHRKFGLPATSLVEVKEGWYQRY